MTPPPPAVTVSRPRDPMALHSALQALADSLNSAEGGNPVIAMLHRSAAGLHADDAYEPGTPEAAALTLIMASIQAEADALAVPQGDRDHART